MPAVAADYSHQEYFEHYEGTSTCLGCHQDEAETFFHSQHYQWTGETPAIVNADGKLLGKKNTINDFCTNPIPAWIGITKNSRGEILSQGCSKCHAGLGKMPSSEMSQEQLENIDCLICHASGYNRTLVENDDGSLEWKPILWKNQEGLDSVSKRITMPKRTSCLRCHAGSGGGPNFKRGDIEYEMADTDREFDVHMGTDGGDMACMDCHAGTRPPDARPRGRPHGRPIQPDQLQLRRRSLPRGSPPRQGTPQPARRSASTAPSATSRSSQGSTAPTWGGTGRPRPTAKRRTNTPRPSPWAPKWNPRSPGTTAPSGRSCPACR